MKIASAALLFTMVGLFAGAPGFAQEGEPPAETATGRIDQMIQSNESGGPIIDAAAGAGSPSGSSEAVPADTGLLPDLVDQGVLGEDGVRSMRAALKAYYDYRVRGFDHRSRVFEWQLLSSRLIFILVILIVAVGLYFSWLQFVAGLKEGAADKLSTSLEASPTSGIKVSSPVLGVIILTLSLAFFYLYLVHVYPIGEIF